jgi:hypothetical protein
MRVIFVCVVSVMAWSGSGLLAAPPVVRSYSAGRFALELDGVQVGLVTGVDGGLPFANVIKSPPGEEFFFKKQLGFPGYRDIRLEFGPGMDKTFYNWIAQALQGTATPMNGAVLGFNFNGTLVSRLEFTRAQITELTIPAANALAKEQVRILIGLTPEQTSLNRSPTGPGLKTSHSTKNALAGNFKVTIDGVNTTRVSKVEALTIKLPFKNNSQGECFSCGDIPAPSPIDFPNVFMTLSQTGAESIEQWFQSFVIAGDNDESKEKSGELTFLTADLQTTLFSVKFNHLGIFELAPVTGASSADNIPRLVASMY